MSDFLALIQTFVGAAALGVSIFAKNGVNPPKTGAKTNKRVHSPPPHRGRPGAPRPHGAKPLGRLHCSTPETRADWRPRCT